MSATIISKYSVELNQGPPGNPQTYLPLRPNQRDARVRMQMFTMALGTEAAGTSIALAKIPKGARILDIVFATSATTGATLTWAFGLAGANGNGYIDDGQTLTGGQGTGIASSDSIGATVSDNTACITAAANYTSANTLVHLPIVGVQNYAASPAAEGVLSIGTGAWLYMVSKDVYLTMTNAAAANANQIIQGYVLYALD